MSQPMHLRAPASPTAPEAAARAASSPLLDDWSSLSPIALPTLASTASGSAHSAWSQLISRLIPKLQSARSA